ncbi:FadR family transcriptional regulator [Ensifer adhaerens]|uniref:FadR/GntR family transcriptional regulator n=1 Tax=Ensifer adhaerens TaxID=106592 RepID=UPI001CBA8987|nr:FadR/GntR family transcriptional regulator [Ensifer adhaerens]MBZ7924545.1 FadR family transcriptional regulator [Ensifer adhaerens]UAX96218.1 FadR family transcriptional regulator [Ensifer adhaerens]UAY04439.1 FadR family transcriptional regulator [Ensifer adhaerens]UAY09871.1 FadR family transcriptional regulator [Ensifer adhaerens]
MKAIAREDRGLPARIAGDIGRRITLGELKVGDTLPKEADMLATLGVSRTTLREALKILSTKGFIEAKPRLGTRVRAAEHWNTLDPVVLSWQGDAEDQEALAEELFEIRLSIEPLAARLAAKRGSAAELADIRAAFLRMAEGGVRLEDAIEADIAFHLQIFQAAHNRFLLPVASVIRAALSISIPKTMAASGGFGQSLAQHEAILSAIEARDGEAAASAAETLIAATYKRNFG